VKNNNIIKIQEASKVFSNTYLSELSTRAPAFKRAKTAFVLPAYEEKKTFILFYICHQQHIPAEAAHSKGCLPSLSSTSTEDPGCASKIFKIYKSPTCFILKFKI
jgi:hypothetical protein